MSDLVAFLRARLDEDQAWADACQGHHWQWVQSQTDEVATPDPMLDEHLEAPDQYGESSSSHLSLRSVEEEMSKPTPRPYGLPPFPGQMLPKSWPIYHCEEVNAAAAGHIIRHDPARVLREVEVKRMLIDELIEGVDEAFGEGSIDHNLRYRGPSTSTDEETGELEEIPEWNVTRQLRLFALLYDAHPDYREEWKP